MRRALLAFVLVLSLVTAGCNAFTSSEPNPAPKTTTELSGQLVPGLSASGFTDREKLTAAHDEILREDSYTARYRVTERASNGSVLGYFRTRYRSGTNRDHFTYHTVQNGTLLDVNSSKYVASVWSNGSLSLLAQTVDETTNYRRIGNTAAREGRTTNRDRLYVLTSVLNVTRIERTNDSGTPMYRVVANDLVHPSLLTNFDTVHNASLVAVIDTWGVVHHYRFEVSGTNDGKAVYRTETFDVSDVGATEIRRPPWYAAAMNATSRRGNSTARSS
ncbi:hypothetical protein A4G99_22325 [Haladaptatus sp. R4]|uniref:hypothetical protein n=1 Tax=Haladaptatus sp. R4 TaxID=1679489 RepID=UPI0007B4C1FA|nr:hypothetical protein [Haladaptatus sp. R4]KZN26180.1 hypothetical protein A4G99_22325 [Haladaptatus sp. R4]